MDSDEFFDADNELEGRSWPANQIAEPPSMSIPVNEEDPEDIEEDPGLVETDDTSGKSVKFITLEHNNYDDETTLHCPIVILKILLDGLCDNNVFGRLDTENNTNNPFKITI